MQKALGDEWADDLETARLAREEEARAAQQREAEQIIAKIGEVVAEARAGRQHSARLFSPVTPEDLRPGYPIQLDQEPTGGRPALTSTDVRGRLTPILQACDARRLECFLEPVQGNTGAPVHAILVRPMRKQP